MKFAEVNSLLISENAAEEKPGIFGFRIERDVLVYNYFVIRNYTAKIRYQKPTDQ